MRSLQIIIAVLLFSSILFSIDSVHGIEPTEDPVEVEVEILGVKEVQSESNESEDKSILETLKDGVAGAITRIIDVLLAPMEAMATVFENWADNISGPLGLLIAGVVLFLLYLLIRFTGVVDMFLDRLN